MAEPNPPTFKNDLDDDDSTPSPDSSDDEKHKSFFNVHKRFHIPGKNRKKKPKTTGTASEDTDMSTNICDEYTDIVKVEEKQHISHEEDSEDSQSEEEMQAICDEYTDIVKVEEKQHISHKVDSEDSQSEEEMSVICDEYTDIVKVEEKQHISHEEDSEDSQSEEEMQVKKQPAVPPKPLKYMPSEQETDTAEHGLVLTDSRTVPIKPYEPELPFTEKCDANDAKVVSSVELDEALDIESVQIGDMVGEGGNELITESMLQDIVYPSMSDIDTEPTDMMESFAIISIQSQPEINTKNEPNIHAAKLLEPLRGYSSADDEEFTTPKECLSDCEDVDVRTLSQKESVKSGVTEDSFRILSDETFKESVIGTYKSISSSVSEGELINTNLVSEGELINTNLVKGNMESSEDSEQFSTSLQSEPEDQCRKSIRDKIKMFDKQESNNNGKPSFTPERRAISESPVSLRKGFNKAFAEAGKPVSKSDSSPHIPPMPSTAQKPLVRLRDQIGATKQVNNDMKTEISIHQFKIKQSDLEEFTENTTARQIDESFAANEPYLNKIQKESNTVTVVDEPPPIQPKSQAVLDSLECTKVYWSPSAYWKEPVVLDDKPPPIRPKSQAVLDSIECTRGGWEPSADFRETATPPPLPSKSMTSQNVGERMSDISISEQEHATAVKQENISESPEGMDKRRQSEPMMSSTEGQGPGPDHQLPGSIPHSHSQGFMPSPYGFDPNQPFYPPYGMQPPFPQERDANYYPPAPMMMDEHGNYYMVPPPPYPYNPAQMMYGGPFSNQPMGPHPSGMPPSHSDFHSGMTPGYSGMPPGHTGMPPSHHSGVVPGDSGMQPSHIPPEQMHIQPEQMEPHYAEIGEPKLDDDEYLTPIKAPARQDHRAGAERPTTPDVVNKTMEKEQPPHKTEVKEKRKSVEPLGKPLERKLIGADDDGLQRQQRKSLGQVPSVGQRVGKDFSPARRPQPAARRRPDIRNVDDKKAGGRDSPGVKQAATAHAERELPVDHQKIYNPISQQKCEEMAVKQEPRAPKQDYYVYIAGLKPSTGADNISNFVEAGASADVRDNSVIFNLNHTAALVTFTAKPNFEGLKKRVSDKLLDGSRLKVHEVAPPTRLAVSSEGCIRSTDNLMYYFERPQIGGGETTSKVSQSEDGSCYIIEFKDPAVVKRLCSWEEGHVVDNAKLRVSPYFSCPAGAIWDRQLHTIPIPDPVHMDIDPGVVKFLERPCCKELVAEMKQKHTDLVFTTDVATLTCTLTPKTQNLKDIVKTWKADTQEVLQVYMRDKVSHMELTVQTGVWSELAMFYKSGAVDKDNIVIIEDIPNRTFAITGFPAPVRQAFDILNKKAAEVDRKNRRTTKKQTLKSSLRLRLLQSMDVFNNINAKLDDVVIHTDHKIVTVEGVPEEIQDVFLQVLQQDSCIEEATYPHDYSDDCVQFIAKQPSIARCINQKLVNNDLLAEWEITSLGLTVVSPPNVQQRSVVRAIKDCVAEEKITIKDEAVELFSEGDWKRLERDIGNEFKSEVKMCFPTTQMLLIFGLAAPTQEVMKRVEEFLEKNTIRHETVRCDGIKLKYVRMHQPNMCPDIMDKLAAGRVKLAIRDTGVEVSGTTAGIQMAKSELTSNMGAIISEPYTIKMVAVRDVFNSELDKGTIKGTEESTKCLIHQPGGADDRGASQTTRGTRGAPYTGAAAMEEHVYDEVDHVAAGGRTGPKSAPKFRAKNGAEVTLVKGEIGKQDGDVFVVTTSPSLNLKSGAASRSILNEGGDELQQECKSLYPKDIKHGQLAEISSKRTKLECNAVYLTCLPEWSAGGGQAKQTLEEFTISCLEKASKDGKMSILFCAMGTGQLGYPKDVVATVMYEAVINFDGKHPRSTLKEIKFVLYQKDAETIKAFEDEERCLLQGGNRPNRPKFEKLTGTLKIDLVIENLAEQQVDAILCTTNSKMDLERSGACKALVKLGGPKLQADCSARYNNSLAAGHVAEITAGTLRCKAIYLTVLPSHSKEAEAMLENIIQQTLSLAQGKKYKSVAIPALGTGYLKYPAQVACDCMYKAVEDWATKNPKSCVQTVKFIMYAKDHQLIQTFKTHVMRSQNRVSRTGRNLDEAPTRPDTKGSQKYNASNDGCHISNIFVKVKLGDILKENADGIVNSVTKDFKLVGAVAGALIKTCGANLQTECEQKQNDMHVKGVVKTGSHGLSAGCIFHVAFQERLKDWKKKMGKCLEKAHKHGLKSLAFPVLGTGGGPKSFTADSIAGCLFEAINDFTSSNPQSSLRDVRVIVFHKQPELMRQVVGELHKKVQEAIGTENKFLGKFRKKVGGFVQENIASVLGYADEDAGLKSQGELRKLRDEMSSITVHIYSDKPANIKRCKKELDGKLQGEYTTNKFDMYQEIVKTISKVEADKLTDVEYLVDINVDQSAGIITIRGPKTYVMDTMNVLHQRLRGVEKERQNVKEADTLYKVIIWHHENIQASGIDHVPYDKMTNLKIENAYKANVGFVELIDKNIGGQRYVIDFNTLEEYPVNDRSDVLKVIRKNILSSMTLPLPNTWAKMDAKENVKVVTLQPTDGEYKLVEAVFVKDVTTGQFSSRYTHTNLKVSKIERIQNRTLYQQYAARRNLLKNERPNPPANMLNERTVWHGTKQDVLASIIMHGFNRSYCGDNTNTNWYGKGVYFAGDASYSARSWLSAGTKTPQPAGFKGYMFMVKALTGEYCQGIKDQRFLPPKDPRHPLVLYDSAVDKPAKPMEFVIFHDTAAYPEYAITFNM